MTEFNIYLGMMQGRVNQSSNLWNTKAVLNLGVVSV